MFNIFIDDINSCFNGDNIEAKPVTLGEYSFNHLLYADDLVLISESPTGLQHCIDAVGTYCNTWNLEINTKKTKTMIFSKRKRKNEENETFQYFQKILETVTEYKYLGLTFNCNGKLNIAADTLSQKARKAFFGLKSKIPFSDNLSVPNWIKLYNSTISPIATYCSEIWITDFKVNLDNFNNFCFEKIQNMIMKQILGVHNKTSNLALHAELGLYPLCFKILRLMFKYYIRLKNIEQSTDSVFTLLRAAFEEDKQLFSHNSDCWIKSFHRLKEVFNFNSLDIQYSEFSKKLNQTYSEKIITQLTHIKDTESGKLRFYSKIYQQFELQKYLTFGINKHSRSFLSKIRLSAHSLAIETGRYGRPPVPATERFCKYCKDKVENEIHFILDCPLYKSVRDKFDSLFLNSLNLGEENAIKHILNPENQMDMKNICSYLKDSFTIRENTFKNIVDLPQSQ